MSTHLTDIDARAKAKLLAQYQEKEKFLAVVEAIAAELQELEDAIQTLNTERFLENAEGEQLNTLGLIVGQDRGALSDEDFAAYIAARIKLNNSNGTIPELVSIFESIAPEDSVVRVLEYFPAALVLQILEVGIGDTAPVMLEFLSLARGAGIYAALEYQAEDDADTFAFFEDAAGQGFTDEATGLTGGTWADALGLDA